MISMLKSNGAKGLILDIVDDLIGYPVLTVSEAAKLHNVTYAAANSVFRRLAEVGVLTEGTGRSYGRVFTCPSVIREVERL